MYICIKRQRQGGIFFPKITATFIGAFTTLDKFEEMCRIGATKFFREDLDIERVALDVADKKENVLLKYKSKDCVFDIYEVSEDSLCNFTVRL